MESFLGQVWFQWGVAILLGMPVIIVITGEIIFLLEKRQSNFLVTVKNIRNFLLPSLFFFLLGKHVLGLGDQSVTVRVLETVFYLLSIHTALKLINVLVFSEALSSDIQNRTPKLLIDFLRGFFVLLGAAFVFSYVWNADLGRLLAALGVGSIVLGLALQDVLGGLFSGLALLSSRPFVVGDWICIGDVEGKVANIDWRAVTLLNRNEDLVIVPNSKIAGEQLFNFSHPSPVHREKILFDLSFDHPPNQVRKILLDVVDATPGILKEPEASVILADCSDFSICYEMRYYIMDYEKQSRIRSSLSSKAWYALQRNNIRYALREAQTSHLLPSAQPEEIYCQLKELSVLEVDEKTLRNLVKHSRLDEFGEGEYVLRKKEMPLTFSIIVRGKAKQTSHVDANKSTSHLLSRGDFFGISGLVSRGDIMVDIRAHTDLLVIAIELTCMKEMLRDNARVAESLESVIKARKKNAANLQ